jgi:hypothetical protein
MLFKKKKAEIPQPEEKTKVIEANKIAVDEVKVKLTPEQEKIRENAEKFMQDYFSAIYSPADFQSQRDAHICNLLFAIYSEIRELRKDIKEHE